MARDERDESATLSALCAPPCGCLLAAIGHQRSRSWPIALVLTRVLGQTRVRGCAKLADQPVPDHTGVFTPPAEGALAGQRGPRHPRDHRRQWGMMKLSERLRPTDGPDVELKELEQQLAEEQDVQLRPVRAILWRRRLDRDEAANPPGEPQGVSQPDPDSEDSPPEQELTGVPGVSKVGRPDPHTTVGLGPRAFAGGIRLAPLLTIGALAAAGRLLDVTRFVSRR